MLYAILDNGHGVDTPGKCSPDKRLLEYKWTREVVDLIIQKLEQNGIKYYKLVPEEKDIPLKERTKRANDFYKSHPECILISVHCNAAGADNKWHNARGLSVFIAQNASSNSKRLAGCLTKQADKENLSIRLQYPDKPYWVQSLAMCRDTKMPAVLTENLFQDNKEDVDFLLSDKGKETIANLHVNAILEYGRQD